MVEVGMGQQYPRQVITNERQQLFHVATIDNPRSIVLRQDIAA
jgi:hypothetical protein